MTEICTSWPEYDEQVTASLRADTYLVAVPVAEGTLWSTYTAEQGSPARAGSDRARACVAFGVTRDALGRYEANRVTDL
jgi:hypothetical protein